MPGPFVHDIDPILGTVFGVHVWWYGLSYTLGFLEMHLFVRRARERIGLSMREVYALSLLFAIGVLAGGRLIEVAFDEWAFYREHPALVPAYWLGGMASHGLLLGAAASVLTFSWWFDKPLRVIADAVVIPGAFLLAAGRVGNFIDGQIVGMPTDAWWAVRFPDAEGFRHPVVLYDGAKNLLLIPLLLAIRRLRPVPGVLTAHFVFWYAFLRFFVDLSRDYPTHRLGVPTGQTLNVVMTLVGAVLLFTSHRRWLAVVRGTGPKTAPAISGVTGQTAAWWQRVAFLAVLLFSLAIPSNWTQDVPARYGQRHPGLRHSAMYPPLDTRPPKPN
jgi:phosphatidylglycerol:prolipoprotein diacylglycerol transferase